MQMDSHFGRKIGVGAFVAASSLGLFHCSFGRLASDNAKAQRHVAAAPAPITVAPGDGFETRLQEALITAAPGSIVELPEGRFKFNDEISIAKPFVTLRGKGIGKTILDFAGQTAGKQGVFATGDGVTLEDFSVLDTDGNGVKVTGANGVTIRRIHVEWTGGPDTENGGYAIYPVDNQNVLIEGCEVSGASDSGIYVGQSRNVIVRNNLATQNVAGIEIENTQNADVYDNESTGNTAGVLVFDLPNLNLLTGGNIRVFRNRIHGNNLRNFAPKGNIVGSVAKGIGFLVVATKKIELFQNSMKDNRFADVVIANYLITGIPIPTDGKYDPTPMGIYVHDNLLDEYKLPQINTRNQINLLANWLFHLNVPDILYDGIRDGTYGGKAFEGEDRICLVRNANLKGRPSKFGNMHLDSGRKQLVFPGGPATRDISSHQCDLKPLLEAKLVPPLYDPITYPEDQLPENALCQAGAPGRVNFDAALGADCTRLAAYRLFSDPVNPLSAPNRGGIPYDLSSPLFSDYAQKSRVLFIPDGEKAKYRDEGVLEFPVGTIISKTFWFKVDSTSARRKVLETRLVIRRERGWVALPYVWNDAQTEATLSRGGQTAEVKYAWIGKPAVDGKDAFTYHIPNANQCQECHSLSGKISPIGPKAKLLNHDFEYGAGQSANQLSYLERNGLLEGLPSGPGAKPIPKLVDYRDAALPIQDRARAYLEINCAHCHNPSGNAGMSGLWLESERDLASPHAGICKHPVAAGTATAKLKFDIVPGKPDESILVRRITSNRPANKMPELGRDLVHDEGVTLIESWIQGLPGNCDGK